MKFRDEAPTGGVGRPAIYDWSAIFPELKANKGKWGLAYTKPKGTQSQNVCGAAMSAVQRRNLNGIVKVAQRKQPDGSYEVWMSWQE